jgi:serine/threonine-protein kinase HipA
VRLAGGPVEDRIELFGRMVFNAVCGNDDDHVRNHAIFYNAERRCWRLAPAFDEVSHWLDQDWKNVLHERLSRNVGVLSGQQGFNDR